MNKENKEKILGLGHYGDAYKEDYEIITSHFKSALLRFCLLIENPQSPKTELIAIILQYFDFATALFSKEAISRILDGKSANLYYHNKHHAVYQAGFDAVQVARGIMMRHDFLSKNLTLEGMLAIVLGALYYDTGYVTAEKNPQNYAALTPVHVEASKKTFQQAVNFLGLPEGIDKEKVIKLGTIGIHNTYFPFTEERKMERQKLLDNFKTPEEKKDAMIVALSVQLADLGGQVARVDYFPTLLKNLREEMEAANPGSGIQIIGQDHELAKKCRGFLDFVVIPTVGKTANAFLGKNNAFSKAFEKNSPFGI
ncbi:hypothetical protein HYW46_02015 [Candidatus Daviesbacteria bacterium]|nr:hypothetical protein [Candidatus Daviesbacteria bacterium]